MLERPRLLSYVFAAAAATVVLLALRVPRTHAAQTGPSAVRVDVVPSFER
jgi:hypothetical protein